MSYFPGHNGRGNPLGYLSIGIVDPERHECATEV